MGQFIPNEVPGFSAMVVGIKVNGDNLGLATLQDFPDALAIQSDGPAKR
jgi:hypothetical protein